MLCGHAVRCAGTVSLLVEGLTMMWPNHALQRTRPSHLLQSTRHEGWGRWAALTVSYRMILQCNTP